MSTVFIIASKKAIGFYLSMFISWPYPVGGSMTDLRYWFAIWFFFFLFMEYHFSKVFRDYSLNM